MRAVLCRELGDPSAIRVEETPAPEMGAGEVRIAVKAAGVNFPDILMIEGKYQMKPGLPFVPGLEVAGTVMQVGDGVTHVTPGQKVMAFSRRGGGYASEIVLPGAIVTPIPDAMDFATAAAFPVVYGTAHFALTHRGQLAPGETLLVLGAAGGVGLATVEVGKMLGATVIAAARGADKLAVCREHGADEGIDYAAEDLRDRVKALTDQAGVDVIFDPVGGDFTTQAVRCIGWQGRILVIGFASGDFARVPTNMVLVKNFSLVGVVFGEHSARYPEDTRERLGSLCEAWEAGHIRPEIFKTYPLEEAATALTDISHRRVKGKVVLEL